MIDGMGALCYDFVRTLSPFRYLLPVGGGSPYPQTKGITENAQSIIINNLMATRIEYR